MTHPAKRIICALTGVLALLLAVPSASAFASLRPTSVHSHTSLPVWAVRVLNSEIKIQLKKYPGGVQISQSRVAYKHGAVIVNFPNPRTGRVDLPDASNNCPYSITDKWFCFYQNANFGGRMVQFQDCGVQDLTNYGFGDETSSWVNNFNNGAAIVNVYTEKGHSSSNLLWQESPVSTSTYVGNADNDRAGYFDLLGGC